MPLTCSYGVDMWTAGPCSLHSKLNSVRSFSEEENKKHWQDQIIPACA